MSKKAALLSVSNREGLAKFALALSEFGYTILSTKGTGSFLEEHGVSVTRIEEYIDQKEILGGRVKTLHPKIHAGILARRANDSDLAELKSEDIFEIDVVAVNLYPFFERLKQNLTEAEMVESIDIGGPTMIRAAAKNFLDVTAIISPNDYDLVIEKIKSNENTYEFRKELAVKVFTELADYNLQISKYFSNGSVAGEVLVKEQELRYGENPHQEASAYLPFGQDKSWKQLQGKELSYNNFLDFDAAARAIRTVARLDKRPVAVMVKHLNPCGAAFANSLVDAVTLAKGSDPVSHFGGIIALNIEVDADTANNITKDFAEIVVAPSFSSESLEILSKKKNLRLIELDLKKDEETSTRSVMNATLIQSEDKSEDRVKVDQLKTKREVSEAELRDLNLAWVLCAHVKSNAIVIVKDGQLLASGGGQMSRVDATEVAIMKAKKHGHDMEGAVAASDAFFPFSDCVELLAEAGVKAVVSPSGSRNDGEVIADSDKLGLSLLHAECRHFRH